MLIYKDLNPSTDVTVITTLDETDHKFLSTKWFCCYLC
jgi:hypothetical protein